MLAKIRDGVYQITAFGGLDMRTVIVAAFAALAVAGCSSAAEQAERQYQIVAKSEAAAGDRCKAARAVADAYLKEENAGKYHETKVRADIVCAANGAP